MRARTIHEFLANYPTPRWIIINLIDTCSGARFRGFRYRKREPPTGLLSSFAKTTALYSNDRLYLEGDAHNCRAYEIYHIMGNIAINRRSIARQP